MDMGHTGQYLHHVFLIMTVFSLTPAIKVNYLQLWPNATTAWDSIIPNSTSRDQSENKTTPVTSAMDYRVNSTNTPILSPLPALTSISTQEPYTLYAVRNSSLTAESTESPSKNHNEIFKKDVCEENKSNMAMLICLIIIAVLFLICTLLFLSTVVLANKVSSLRRSKQVGKRQPRSNGDFLASSGLWPAESDTWKRPNQLTGPHLLMQSTGVLTASRERKGEEGTEKLN